MLAWPRGLSRRDGADIGEAIGEDSPLEGSGFELLVPAFTDWLLAI